LQSIQDTPTYSCCICDRFSFGKDMQSINKDMLSTIFYMMLASEFKSIKFNEKICKYCNNEILNEKFPTFALPLYIRRNEKLIFIAHLTYLEERLVAPRMDFAQISQLSYKRSQIWLRRTIINVPSNLNWIQRASPRDIDDNMTVGIMLKRKLEYKNAYLSRNIFPKKVMCALHDFWNTSLYKREQIVINYEWKKLFVQSKQDHHNDSPKMEELDSPNVDNDLEQETETLVRRYSEAHLIHDLDTRII